MKPEKSAEVIVVEAIQRRAEPMESRELKFLERFGQKPRTEGLG
jgi:hypothetical protein